MRGLPLGLAAVCAFGLHGSIVAQDFRVELFSGRGLRALALQAGGAGTNLCDLRRPRYCLALEPRTKASCVRTGAGVRCSSPNASREFQGLSAYSTMPFQVTAEFLKAQAPNPVMLSKLEIKRSRSGLIAVLPTDLESYVAGVLAGEAAILRSPAAREAMAILARTWAIRWRGRHQAEGFDFCSLTHCQAFRPPVVPEIDPTSEAVARETRGQILQFRGELVDPYFSAACGGMTEAAGNVWPDRAQPYLVSIHDPYCAGSEHASWQRVLPLEEAERIVRTDMHVPLRGPLTRVTIAKTDSSGRAQILLAQAGVAMQIDANEFRYAANRRLGWATLKSNLYTIDLRGDSLIFSGRGLGHGVGLCQAGAEQMGRMGYSAQQILAYYFPRDHGGSPRSRTGRPHSLQRALRNRLPGHSAEMGAANTGGA